MNVTLRPGTRTGSVSVPASKSAAHRLLILASLGEMPVTLVCDGMSEDIEATIACMRALGAAIMTEDGMIRVTPAIRALRQVQGPDRGLDAEPVEASAKQEVVLPCGESGSTLRFLLPVAAALGVSARFTTAGRLSERPLTPLTDALSSHGAHIEKDGTSFLLTGTLSAGTYTVPGDISSQFITGLLMALPLLEGNSELLVTGNIESADYIRMTEEALKLADIRFIKEETPGADVSCRYEIAGGQMPRLSDTTQVERDWSAAANFLVTGALSEQGITVTGLDTYSAQGDKEIINILRRFGADVTEDQGSVTVRKKNLQGITLDASMVPDLVPAVSALAAVADGETRITGAARLRLKESDRLETTANTLNALGAEVTVLPDGLRILGKKKLAGGTTPLCTDHRIAMAAAICASTCENAVTVRGAECTTKSFPHFFETFNSLQVKS